MAMIVGLSLRLLVLQPRFGPYVTEKLHGGQDTLARVEQRGAETLGYAQPVLFPDGTVPLAPPERLFLHFGYLRP